MTRILFAVFLMVSAIGISAQAQTAPEKPKQAIHQDKKAISQAYQTLDSDNQEIRALDKQRDDALRSNNPAAAKQIQAQIDQKRAAQKKTEASLKKDENNLQQQKHLAAEDCAKDPACAKRKRQEVLDRQLTNLRQKLAFDEAAAASIPKDKAAIDQIEAELKK